MRCGEGLIEVRSLDEEEEVKPTIVAGWVENLIVLREFEDWDVCFKLEDDPEDDMTRY